MQPISSSAATQQQQQHRTRIKTECRATIEKLRKDNDTLKEELFLENKFSVTPVDNIAAHRITAMQEEADALTRKVRSTPHDHLLRYEQAQMLR